MHVLEYWAIQRSWFARVNALCNLSEQEVARGRSALPGRFLSRSCFTLCKQWKLNLESRSSRNANTIAVAKITVERGWRVEKKCLCVGFWLTRRLRVHRKMRFGASYSTSNKLLLIARQIMTTGHQKCF